ncbi:prephenate dehydrogenase [Alcaligenes endophyticus]|uniref:Prephenate dehydrogenase/arogenate dehydrogenase family protein n=1 Tax=Alcaligenes endophyticus TaxID=1929088 RepID=A0ABT8EI23_9BURK|nr:prephenate dehydrogenase/arogenate dehydrogenase family protein [Alcaligenes endophyticus]MCX5592754.1 prephenate dehydrogenase/arogenate dehydrogenase family protein [Alcaligenes endophyticus]MDN4120942.1 prephenate dehydrogenase/arogenate dehydrogenase family protein [Alcaligenes endophyticus]
MVKKEQPLQGRPLIDVLAVVGVGLIGGSFALALRRAGVVGRVIGVGRSQETLRRAVDLGLVDETASAQDAAQQADIIFLSTPIGAMQGVLQSMQPYLRSNALITDGGSTKHDVVKAARLALGEKIAHFIPGHPIAGAETTGPEAAYAELYDDRNVILTPLEENSQADRDRLSRIWQSCGARVMFMDPYVHDQVLASVSHVPHFLASVFMGQVASAANSDQRFALAGTGFRDFTRIAAGSAEVWRDIFLSNREAVLAELDEVRLALDAAQQALQAEDGQALYDFLERAAVARRFWASRSGLK